MLFRSVLSAETGGGFSALEEALGERITKLSSSRTAPLITRRRHRDALSTALFHVKQARADLERGFGAEIVSEDVRLAAQKLGALVGRIDVEDILGEVFSSFCIGK